MLYTITIINAFDNSTRTISMLSYEHLDIKSSSLEYVKLDSCTEEIIVSVRPSEIQINGWSEEEENELTELKNKLTVKL